jgi:DNA helicase-2/ATP-dependent DNA helicase PcrA
MEVIADLHIHSRYSIATGREADLEHLDLWGRYKGLKVVGTGDCTHPAWLKELGAKLDPAGEGAYRLKGELALPLNLRGPYWDAAPRVRFVVTGEVSTIYQKGGRVRKVHLLLVLPSLEAARLLSQRLGRLGNVTADGRPILGLDAKHLLELVLDIAPEALVIPAHIWTPWFSVLGSKSGFDSLEECFEEQTARIYALETGLSSDPPMNWRVSALDRYLLVSNSDAHSPAKLGREANIFLVAPDYPSLARAVRRREGCGGTLEFFPQEGKYHLDGHRACGLRLAPEEAAALGGICPKCGKPLTYGVMHRVQDLADRPPGAASAGGQPFESLIPLVEVLAEVLGVGPGSRKVQGRYFRLLEKLGPELEILRRVPLEAVAREGGALLAHGLDRMRRGAVHIVGGFDGQYGEIRLFTPEERRRLEGQGGMFAFPGASTGAEPGPPGAGAHPPGLKAAEGSAKPFLSGAKSSPALTDDPLLAGLNALQRQAVLHEGPPLIVQAGPGTGKTRALTHRLAHLLARRGAAPGSILAVTFTRQAAGEMEARLRRLLPDFPGLEEVAIKTFHALGHQLLLSQGEAREVAEEERRRRLLRDAAKAHGLRPAVLERRLTRWKQALIYPGDLAESSPEAAAFAAYEEALAREGRWDFEDLIARPALLLARRRDLREAWRERFRYLLVDEYQDLNEAQYAFFRVLAGEGADLMVIGDPDQAIYGFRGASPEYFARFREDWPGAVSLTFTETYRLPPPVLRAAREISGAPGPALVTHRFGAQPVELLEEATPEAEARAIAREIEALVGGLSHLALEGVHRGSRHRQETAGFKDVAVLYRVHALGPELERGLTAAGIPCQQPREGVGPEWDGLDLAAEKVKLLTLHGAKGLEFPYVFIAGCEKGLIPWEPEGEEPGDPGEERRLLYVGLTRASRQVFLTRARRRTLWGKTRAGGLSPLVQALPPEALRRREQAGGAGRGRTRQRLLFPPARPPGRGGK